MLSPVNFVASIGGLSNFIKRDKISESAKSGGVDSSLGPWSLGMTLTVLWSGEHSSAEESIVPNPKLRSNLVFVHFTGF